MKLLLIGDSLTYGYRVQEKYKWTNILGRELGIEISNRGALGDTTAGMNLRLSEDLLNEHPDMVFIMGGTNDFLMGYPLKNVQKNLKQMIQDINNLSLKVIVGVQPPTIHHMAELLWIEGVNYNKVNDKIKALREWIINNSSEYNFNYIDFLGEFNSLLLQEDFNNYYIDGVHMNNIGHEVMAKIALDFIKKIQISQNNF